MKNTKGYLRTEIITENKRLNFDEYTQGIGAKNLTIQNDGDVPFYVKGVVIEPRESFIIETDIAILNDDFEINFEDKEGVKKAMVFYIVEKIC